MSTVDLRRARWRKSSRSGDGNNGACVEVRFAGDAVAVRDSKNPTGAVFALPVAGWRSFLAALQHGAFDRGWRRSG